MVKELQVKNHLTICENCIHCITKKVFIGCHFLEQAFGRTLCDGKIPEIQECAA